MVSREEIIKMAKDVAKQLGVSSLSRKIFISKTGISEWQIIKLFDSWNDVVEEGVNANFS